MACANGVPNEEAIMDEPIKESGFYIYHDSMDCTLLITNTINTWNDYVRNHCAELSKFAISTSSSLQMIDSKLKDELIKQIHPLIDEPLFKNNRNILFAETSQNVKIYDIINPFFDLETNNMIIPKADIVNILNLKNQPSTNHIGVYLSNMQQSAPINTKQIDYIPAIFNCKKIDDDWNVNIQSEINNLPKFLYPDLYCTLQHIFSHFTPLFMDIMSSPDDYDGQQRSIYKESITEKLEYNFKVIVKAQMYELQQTKNKNMDENDLSFYEGSYHLEGGYSQNIAAVGLYYFDISNNIDGGQLNICKSARYGLNNNNSYDIDIDVKNETVVVFNNKSCIHKVKKIMLNADEQQIVDDKYHIGHRKLLSFFVLELNDETIKCSDQIMVNLPYKAEYIINAFNRNFACNELVNDIKMMIYDFCCGSKQYIENQTDLARSIFAEQNVQIIDQIQANPSD